MSTLSIDGREYEFDGNFDLGEARVVKRYTGLTLKDLEGHDPSDPDLIAAFVHITFRRETPQASWDELEARVNAAKLATLLFEQDEEAVDVGPPASEPVAGGLSIGES
jgi:hypothetical protein